MKNNMKYHQSEYTKGGETVLSGCYYFLKIPNNVKITGNDDIRNLLFTSAYINSYIKNTTIDNQIEIEIQSNHVITNQSHLYLLRMKSPTYDNILIFNANDHQICICPYEFHSLNEVLRNVAQSGITRHHIIEAETYLKYMHEHSKRFDPNEKYDYNNESSWANGNLLLGPSPEFNFHDGTKSGERESGFFNGNVKAAHRAGINVPKSEQCYIEAYIGGIKSYNSKTDANKEYIKKCANAFFATQKMREMDLKGEQINLPEARTYVNEFWENWEKLKKLPMLTGVWSPVNNNPTTSDSHTKLKCEVLLHLEKDILKKLVLHGNQLPYRINREL